MKTLCLLTLASFIMSCSKELQYIEPFRWGSVSEMYGIKGPVELVVDTIVPYTYLSLSNQNLPIDTAKRFVFRVVVNSNGYPSQIVASDDTASSLVFNIDANTRAFLNAQLVYFKNRVTGLIVFPDKNSFSIRVNYQNDKFITVKQCAFNSDFSVKIIATTNTTSLIETKTVYTKTGQGEPKNDETFIEYSNGFPSFSGERKYNAQGLLVTLSKNSLITNNNSIVENYTYGDLDAYGNFTTRTTTVDGIITEVLKRTIKYR